MGFGLATIAIVFAIGWALRGPLTGIIAAGLFAAMPLHISDSRFLTTDVPVAFFCALTLLCTPSLSMPSGSVQSERATTLPQKVHLARNV